LSIAKERDRYPATNQAQILITGSDQILYLPILAKQ
jgi:hypothetical protein